MPSLNWAQDTFAALSDTKQQLPNWTPFSGPDGLSNQAFTIPPSLLTHASIERYGQVTPPEELSPAELGVRGATREGSIPVDQLRNETNWSPLPDNENTIQAAEQSNAQQQDNVERPAKRRRTSSRQSSANQSMQPSTAPPQQSDPANLQPPKRKRGRPKSQPQMVEAFTADGFPFQVSSARQSHLEKNRVAAHKCRQRKKEYINGLEGRAREFSSKNKALKENVAMLREEVLGLKNEVLRHAGCGFWAVDEYLARCAGDLLGMGPPANELSSHNQLSHPHSPEMGESARDPFDHKDSFESMSTGSSPDNFGGLEDLLQMDDDGMDDGGW